MKSRWTESKITLKLAVPLMIGQLNQMLLGVVDTLMVGALGVQALAALTFANSMFHIPLVAGIGLLTGVAVFSASARGAGKQEDARVSCRNGVILGLLAGLVLSAGAWLLSMNLSWLHQPEEVTKVTVPYFRIIMVSLIPAMGSMALKMHADAMNRPWVPFWIFLGGVMVNIGLNWLWISGRWGFPAMGIEGAGWATLTARCLIFVAMWLWMNWDRMMREWIPQGDWLKWDGKGLKKMFVMGLPAAGHMIFEVSAFSIAGLWMGLLGTLAMASHQIAITLAGTSFMIPLGLSQALTVRVGEVVGSGESKRLRGIAQSGWLLVVGYGLMAGVSFMLYGEGFAGFFTADPEVIRVAAGLLMIVGVFQVVDGLQVASSAMLRGLHETRIPAVVGLLSYWLIGIPMSGVLAFWCHIGANGIWWGLAIGLMVACFALGPWLWRLILRTERQMRLESEGMG